MRGAEIINNDVHRCFTTSKNLLPVVLINEENSLSECQVEVTASKLLMFTLPALA